MKQKLIDLILEECDASFEHHLKSVIEHILLHQWDKEALLRGWDNSPTHSETLMWEFAYKKNFGDTISGYRDAL